MKNSSLIITLLIVVVGLLVCGLIGSSEAAKIGTTCDFGLGEDGSVFCWKWHQNVIGEFGSAVNQIFNN